MSSAQDASLTAGSSPPAPSHRRAWASGVLFAAVGGAVLAWLVARSNPALLWATVERGAGWVPVLFVIEGARVAIEAWGGRGLYSPRIPYPALLRASLVAYAVAALAPAGRAAGEAVKAGMLRDRTGLSDTAAAATTIQTCSLLALGFWSLVCATFAAPVSTLLAGTFALQAVVVLAGAALVRGMVSKRALARLADLVGRFAPSARAPIAAMGERARGQRLGVPLAAFAVSRGLELVQYALVFLAITGRLDAVRGVIAFGVATVSGSLGDSVPAQLGVMDGSFATAAGALHLTREDALAFSLLAHAFQIAAIAVGLLTPIFWRQKASSRL
jgi:hypothetical protein